jgi:hypothetical protein
MLPCQQDEKSMLGHSKPQSWLDPTRHGSLEISEANHQQAPSKTFNPQTNHL